MKSLALLHSEDGDTTLLRKLGNYQSTRRNIRETAHASHLRQNLMTFHFPKLRMCLMK
jgi:hypothetical protein